MHSPTALTLSKWSSLYPHAPYADHYQLKPALLQTIGIVVQSCLGYRVAQLSESIIYRMERRRFTVETCESRMTDTVGRDSPGRGAAASAKFYQFVRVTRTVEGILRKRP